MHSVTAPSDLSVRSIQRRLVPAPNPLLPLRPSEGRGHAVRILIDGCGRRRSLPRTMHSYSRPPVVPRRAARPHSPASSSVCFPHSSPARLALTGYTITGITLRRLGQGTTSVEPTGLEPVTPCLQTPCRFWRTPDPPRDASATRPRTVVRDDRCWGQAGVRPRTGSWRSATAGKSRSVLAEDIPRTKTNSGELRLRSCHLAGLGRCELRF
jgi:hypothetical protein